MNDWDDWKSWEAKVHFTCITYKKYLFCWIKDIQIVGKNRTGDLKNNLSEKSLHQRDTFIQMRLIERNVKNVHILLILEK